MGIKSKIKTEAEHLGTINKIASLLPIGINLSLTNTLVAGRLLRKGKTVVVVVKKDGRFPYVFDIPTPADFDEPDTLCNGEPYGVHFISTLGSKGATVIVANGSVKKVKPRSVILGMMKGNCCKVLGG